MVMKKKSAPGEWHSLTGEERVERTALFDKYSHHATVAAQKFKHMGPWPLRGIDEHDLRQIGLEKLWLVLSRKNLPVLRDPAKEKAYFRNVIFNAIKTQRSRALGYDFKLLSERKEEPEGGKLEPMLDRVPAPKRALAASASSKRIMDYLTHGLEPKEIRVLELYLNGVSHAEIAKEVGWGKSSVSFFVTQTLEEKLRRSGRASQLRDLLQAA